MILMIHWQLKICAVCIRDAWTKVNKAVCEQFPLHLIGNNINRRNCRYSSIVFLKFEAAIEAAGYTWFLENVVNNGNGGWPLALGPDRFVEADFDVAEVAGIS